MERTLKIIVLSSIMMVLSYSWIINLFHDEVQDFLTDQFGININTELVGAYTKTPLIAFTTDTWFDGSFQENWNLYADENIELRARLVCLKNEIHYDFFRESGNNTVVVGKDNYLFEKKYLTSLIGEDYIGYNTIQARVQQLKNARKKLKLMGKDLLVLIAPSKGYFNHEKLPQAFVVDSGVKTNYRVYKDLLQGSGLPYINFNDYFLSIKNKTPYPLIPRVGAHWSNYGAALACDSIIKKLEAMSGKKMNHFKINPTAVSDDSGFSEEDLEVILNLLKPLKNIPLAHPVLEFESDSSKYQPRVIAVSDSYYWNIQMLEMPQHCFANDAQFWYYYKTVYKTSVGAMPLSTVNIKAELDKADIIILMATEPNLAAFPFGFLEELNRYLK